MKIKKQTTSNVNDDPTEERSVKEIKDDMARKMGYANYSIFLLHQTEAWNMCRTIGKD